MQTRQRIAIAQNVFSSGSPSPSPSPPATPHSAPSLLAASLPRRARLVGAPSGPNALNGSSVVIHLYVEEVDAITARAVDAGAKITMPVQDMF